MARYYIQTAAGPKRKALYAKSRSEAATMIVHAIADRDGSGPITIEPSNLSTAGYFAEWRSSTKSELVPDTHLHYSGFIEHHLSSALGSLKLAELRRAHVEHQVSRLPSHKLEPSTIRYIMAVLSAALNRRGSSCRATRRRVSSGPRIDHRRCELSPKWKRRL